MSKLVSISDYYLQDVPEGTLFLPSSVTSLPDEFSIPSLLVNRYRLINFVDFSTLTRFHNSVLQQERGICLHIRKTH